MGLCASKRAFRELEARVAALEGRDYPLVPEPLAAQPANRHDVDGSTTKAQHTSDSQTEPVKLEMVDGSHCLPEFASISSWPRASGDVDPNTGIVIDTGGADAKYENVGRHGALGMIGGKSFTFETWVCLDEEHKYGNYFVFSSDSPRQSGWDRCASLKIACTGSGSKIIRWAFFNGHHQVQMPISPCPVRKWFHVAASYDFNKKQLRLIYYLPFEDGKPEHDLVQVETADDVPPLVGNAMLRISRWCEKPWHPLQGHLAEFRLWNYVRSPSEVEEQRSLKLLPRDNERMSYRLE